MNLSIIEDCSPYYIRFTHNGVDDVISKCLKFINLVEFTRNFESYTFPVNSAKNIMDLVPMASVLNLTLNRVSLFVTGPGAYYRAHKDGNNPEHRYSINYTVKILDDKCVTSWYSDNDLKDYIHDSDPLFKYSRECLNFDKNKHTPLQSMTAIQGECILFNTDIYHDFDNSKSTNKRMVLTLRDIKPDIVYFEDARKVLFDR